MPLVETPNFDFLNGIEHPAAHIESPVYQQDAWGYNDSTFEDYLAPAPAGTKPRIKAVLGGFSHNVALDIAGGSNAQALRDLLEDDLIDQGIVTNLHDTRVEHVRNNPSLEHVEGDLIRPETWMQIIAMQRQHAPDGFSLIMFRPIAGLMYLDRSFFDRAAHIVLDMVRPGGALLTQIPKAVRYRDIDPYDRDPLCTSIEQRGDVKELLSPKEFQVRPTALLVKK